MFEFLLWELIAFIIGCWLGGLGGGILLVFVAFFFFLLFMPIKE